MQTPITHTNTLRKEKGREEKKGRRVRERKGMKGNRGKGGIVEVIERE